MGDRRATLTVGVEGAEEAIAAANRVKDSWANAGKGITSGFKEVGSVVGNAVGGMVTDITKALSVVHGLNFAEAMSSARQYDQVMGRFAAGMGKGITDISGRFEQLSRQKLVPEVEIAKFAKGMRSVTFDAGGAIDAFAGLADEAVALGRSPEEMQGLGVVLHNTLGVTGDTTAALGVMRAQAELLGTVGGPEAVYSTLQGIAGVLQNISDKTPGVAGKLGALAAGFGGSGLKPGQRTEALGGVLGKLQGEQYGWIHNFLGKNVKDYQDSEGRLKDPMKLMEDVQKKLIKRYGRTHARTVAQNTFGDVAGAALMNTDFDALERDANAKPIASKNAPKFYSSPEGQRLLQQQEADRNMRKNGDKVNKWFDKTGIGDWVSKNPGKTGLGLLLGGSLGGSLLRGGIKGAFSAAGEGLGGAVAAYGGLATAGAVGAGLLLGGGLGAGLGYGLDKYAGDSIDSALGDPFGINETNDQISDVDKQTRVDKLIRDQARQRRGQYSGDPSDPTNAFYPGSPNGGPDAAPAGPVMIGNTGELAQAIADAMRAKPTAITVENSTNTIVTVDGQVAGAGRQ